MAWIFRRKLYKLISRVYYSKKFAEFGESSYILNPIRLGNEDKIQIGAHVHINLNAWIAALDSENKNVISIGDYTYIGNFFHLVAKNSVRIEENVLIADRVFIADNSHDYRDISTPIQFQSIVDFEETVIGSGSWIGEGVCILGASIGRNSVVGANSVVTRDIPDYSVAVGCPAVVIKQYCSKTGLWINV